MKKLPKTLYVKHEKDDSTGYFVADETADALVEMGEEIKIGEYQLVRTTNARGVASFGGKSRRR